MGATATGCEVTNEIEQEGYGGGPLKPLTVSVQTAAALLGVGTTSIWGLIASRRIQVIRIGRRTLVVMTSLEALVATRVASQCKALLESQRNEELTRLTENSQARPKK